MKLMILDRDGVINYDSDAYIKSPAEWVPIPGSLEAIARLCHAGFRIVVASNQSGVGRGLLTIEDLNRIHEKMHRMAYDAGGAIDAVFFCTDTDDSHYDRKPNPGLLEEIGRRLKISLRGIPAVGDSWRDMQAARAVGALPVLVRTGKGERTVAAAGDLEGVLVFDNLAAIADFVLAQPE